MASIPLLYRLLAFGSLASAGAVVFAIWVTSAHIDRQPSGDPHWGIATALIAVGLTITIAANLVLMRMAFRPVESLEAAIGQLRRGRMSARARRYAMGDARIDRLIYAFNDMAESLERQRGQVAQLSSRVLAAHEEERRRIARELHDEAGQSLTSLLLGLKALETVNDEAERKERLAGLLDSTSQTLDELRRLARNLRPPVLDDLGLGPALGSLLNEFSQTSGLEVERHISDLRGGLSKDAEVALYRVAQEALTNVAKHAQATRVSVRLEDEHGTARVSIEDDGVGFEASEILAGAGAGLGVAGMQDRMALVGGSLRIRSRLDSGTTVVGEVPAGGHVP